MDDIPEVDASLIDNDGVFSIPSPPSGWVEDFHFRAIEHARHTTKPLAR